MKKRFLVLPATLTFLLSAGVAMSLQSHSPAAISASAKPLLIVQPVQKVVELFTSQGCSSCPKSNAQLTGFTKQDGILGLTYGVEYWDYLGWKDTFAQPLFSDRQRAYSAALGHGRVYTPQIIVNGALDKPRFEDRELAAISLPESRPQISLTPSGELRISAQSEPGALSAIVRLISYMPGEHKVDIGSGENGGRTLNLSNVVTGVAEIGTYMGQDLTLDLPARSNGPDGQTQAYAVLIQDAKDGPILAAAKLNP